MLLAPLATLLPRMPCHHSNENMGPIVIVTCVPNHNSIDLRECHKLDKDWEIYC